MKKEEILALFGQFEQAACEVNQIECWSARELQKLLGYSKWENFSNVIEKAKEACRNVGQDVADHFPGVRKMITAGKGACENVGQSISDHFIDVNKMVEVGSGAKRSVDDIMLTRYACYLVAQNGDPRKPEMILGLAKRQSRAVRKGCRVGLFFIILSSF